MYRKKIRQISKKLYLIFRYGKSVIIHPSVSIILTLGLLFLGHLYNVDAEMESIRPPITDKLGLEYWFYPVSYLYMISVGVNLNKLMKKVSIKPRLIIFLIPLISLYVYGRSGILGPIVSSNLIYAAIASLVFLITAGSIGVALFDYLHLSEMDILGAFRNANKRNFQPKGPQKTINEELQTSIPIKMNLKTRKILNITCVISIVAALFYSIKEQSQEPSNLSQNIYLIFIVLPLFILIAQPILYVYRNWKKKIQIKIKLRI